MFRLLGKKINTILRSNILLNWFTSSKSAPSLVPEYVISTEIPCADPYVDVWSYMDPESFVREGPTQLSVF